MSEKSFISSLLSRLSASKNRRLKRAARRSAQPAEQLEARELLSAITVDALHDVTDANDGETTLREAVAIANQDPATLDTITFVESFDFDVVRLTQGQLTLSGNIVIDASANGLMRINQDHAARRVIGVSAGADVELRNVVVQGGRVYGNANEAAGAGIRNEGTLTLEGSIVGQNSLFHDSLPGRNVLFTGGAGIYNAPGASLALNRSSVGAVRLDVDSLDGLGIDPGRFIEEGDGTNTPYLVRPNYSEGIGGGVFNEGQMTLVDSSIEQNQAIFGGGGIYNAGDAQLTNTTVAENDSGRNLVWRGENAAREVGHNGGGIVNAERVPVRYYGDRPNSFVPYSYQFEYRDTDYTGAPSLELIRSIVSDHDTQFGAGIFNESADLSLVQSTISNNTTQDERQLADNTFGVISGLHGGGGVFVASGDVHIEATTFSNNASHSIGGGIAATDDREVYIESSTFSGNHADRGGAIYVNSFADSVGRPLTVVHSTITNNTADQGGGIWVRQAGRETIIGSIVAGNTASAFANIAADEGIVRSGGWNLIGAVDSGEFVRQSSDLSLIHI